VRPRPATYRSRNVKPGLGLIEERTISAVVNPFGTPTP
jgi:hypothetical protein